MKTASIGFIRDDGDFQLLATLNNNDELMSEEGFITLVGKLRSFYGDSVPACMYEDVLAIERHDAPDYVTLD